MTVENKDDRRPKLLCGVTSASGWRLLQGQLAWMSKQGFDVIGISGFGPSAQLASKAEGVPILEIPICREINPLQDARSLLKLIRQFLVLRPDVTNLGTPKMGLLGGLAAWITGVPCRVYTLRGLRMQTENGLRREVLLWSEKIACACAHLVIPVSESLRNEVVRLRITKPEKTVVLGAGSSNGVDVNRYVARSESPQAEPRKRLEIPVTSPVIGFVGRMNSDKGIEELWKAFLLVLAKQPEARLLAVGDFEGGEMPRLRSEILADPRVTLTGFVAETAPYYQLMDVLAFPSRREGFPNVVLEAAASGVPVVAVKATGTMDAVIDGQTGFLVPANEPEKLADRIVQVISDKQLRHSLGKAARQRVETDFTQEKIWEGLLSQYRALLEKRCNRRFVQKHPVADV